MWTDKFLCSKWIRNTGMEVGTFLGELFDREETPDARDDVGKESVVWFDARDELGLKQDEEEKLNVQDMEWYKWFHIVDNL